MIVKHLPIDYSRTIGFYRISRYNLECAIVETTVSLLASRLSYPTITAQMRALGILNTKLLKLAKDSVGAPKAEDILRVCVLSGKGLAALASAFTHWAVNSRTKIGEGWASREIAAAATTEVVRAIDPDFMPDREILDFVMYAVPGTGPERSEREAVAIAYQLTRFAFLFSGSNETGPAAAAVRILLVDLLGWVRHALAEKTSAPQVLTAGRVDEALAARISTLRDMAGFTLGMNLSATQQVTRHFLRWLKDPWIKSISYGKQADKFDRMIISFEERTPSPGPFTSLSSLNVTDAYDMEIIELDSLVALIPQPTVALPRAYSMYRKPLSVDMRFPLRIEEEGLAKWLDAGWRMVRLTQEAATLFTIPGVESLPTINVTDRFPAFRGEGGIAGIDTVTGIPIITPSDPSVNWPTSDWALFGLDFDPNCFHTRQFIVEHIAAHPLIPVRLSGATPESYLEEAPSIQPVLKALDEARTLLPMELASIAMMWGMTLPRLVKQYSFLPNDPSLVTWRAIAEALRFIGVLTVNEQIVEPFSRHWYHGIRFNKLCFAQPFTFINTEVMDNGNRIGGVVAVFHPFKAIPTSARLSAMPDKLATVLTERDNSGLPLLQWIDTSEVGPSNVEIVGWMNGEGTIDVFLVESVPIAPRPFFLTAATDVGPMGGRFSNFAMDASEPVKEALPPLLPPPAGAYSYIDKA
jgi:hypothetical protein